MTGFDLALAFDARVLDLLSRKLLRRCGVALLGCVDHDPLELGFFVEEIRDIEERIAFAVGKWSIRLPAKVPALLSAQLLFEIDDRICRQLIRPPRLRSPANVG